MPEIPINISPKVFNPVYLPFIHDSTRTQIFFGGSSSGKSHFVAGQRITMDLLSGRNYLSVRNTANTLRFSTFNEIRKTISSWRLSSLFKINKSEMTVTALNGRQAIFKGLDDTEKVKSITPEVGVITDIHVEEATECSEEDIKQLERRLRGRSYFPKRITLTFNPILKTHWIYKKYFTDWDESGTLLKKPNLLILKTTYKDNRFLEPEDIAVLEDETDAYWYQVYTLGNWGILGDVIFKNWKTEDLSSISSTFDNFRNGLDFGFGPDPAAFVRCHYDAKRKRLYIVKDLEAHELTNPELAVLVRPIAGQERVVCDSAEPKSIKELRRNKVNAIGAKKGPDSVRHGIQWLQQQEIIIGRDCQAAQNEFGAYHWKKNKQGEVLPIPADKDDHMIDATRYATEDLQVARRVAGRLI